MRAPRWRTWLPRRSSLRSDLLAGLPTAISSVPDGMAAGVLAGVNPVHGLYASFAGPIAGGATTSTKLMLITTTSAAALAAGSALESVPRDDRGSALVLLTLLAGAVMIAAGLLRLGRYTRFVSHSVMIGFLTGISVNIVLGQLPDLTGSETEGGVGIAKAWDVLSHPSQIHVASLLVGSGALVLLVTLRMTPARLFASLVALAVPTTVVILAGADGVATVGAIPTGLPVPRLPDLGLLSVNLVSGAVAVAAIVLVQGAGVAESAPNPGGRRSDADRDFAAQGVGNLAASLVGGQPVGGSVGQTSLNVAAGGRSRWASIFAGLWMLAILVVFAGLVARVAMPTLSAVLVYAAIGSLRPGLVTTVWRTGPSSKVALATTCLATLTLPVSVAVGIGVALSLLLQLNQEAVDLKVVRLVPQDDGSLVESTAPTGLADHRVVVLDVYGSLFYAGARTLQANLPDPAGAREPYVVLRMRGRSTLGATFFSVVADYARRLESQGGGLYLSGLSAGVLGYWDDNRLDHLGVSLEVFAATEVIGESTRAAFDQAQSRRVRAQ